VLIFSVPQRVRGENTGERTRYIQSRTQIRTKRVKRTKIPAWRHYTHSIEFTEENNKTIYIQQHNSLFYDVRFSYNVFLLYCFFLRDILFRTHDVFLLCVFFYSINFKTVFVVYGRLYSDSKQWLYDWCLQIEFASFSNRLLLNIRPVRFKSSFVHNKYFQSVGMWTYFRYSVYNKFRLIRIQLIRTHYIFHSDIK